MWKKIVQLLIILAAVHSSEFEWCSPKCICPSQKEVFCHSGGFSEIPILELPSLVEHLSFMKNNFTVIKADAFIKLKNLRKLVLDGNNIMHIRSFAFRGVPKLEELYINNTNLSALSPFSFAGLLNVRNIFLGNNLIGSIGRNAFAGTSNVESINLSRNPLLRINSSAFSGLRHVRYLILPSGIKHIEPEAFTGMDAIGLIKLPYMDLPSLRPNTFHGLNNVYGLMIQDSDLGIIQPNAFANLSSVGLISLTNNKIDSIRQLVILDSQNIETIKLDGNHILDVPPPGFVVLEVSKEVIVTRNHFPCDCRIHYLLDSPLATGNKSLFLGENYCISPLEVNGKPMSSLDLQSIGGCNDETSVLNRNSAAFCERYSHIIFPTLLSLYMQHNSIECLRLMS